MTCCTKEKLYYLRELSFFHKEASLPTSSSRISTLDHEIGDDSVENRVVVVAPPIIIFIGLNSKLILAVILK